MSAFFRLIPKRVLPQSHWGDEEFSRRRFRRKQGRSPEVQDPTRFTDHLYRIKVDGTLFDPLRQYLTDKEFAKQYIAHTIGPQYVPETYEILRNEANIHDFIPDRLPCVVKPTHLSGYAVFCTHTDGKFDRDALCKWLRTNHYNRTREGNYRYLRPKVIIEEFISEDGVSIPKDYKVFCFSGIPKIIQVDSSRFNAHTQNFYDIHWNRIPITFGYPSKPEVDEMPAFLDELLRVASRLSAPLDFVRVDLYASDTRIKAGELTFCPQSADKLLLPSSADIALARLFDPDYRLDARVCAEEWSMQ